MGYSNIQINDYVYVKEYNIFGRHIQGGYAIVKNIVHNAPLFGTLIKVQFIQNGHCKILEQKYLNLVIDFTWIKL